MVAPSKPIADHVLAGTYRKDRHGERADGHISTDPLPDPPDWMTEEAKAEYNRVKDAFGDTGILTCLDASSLAIYAQLWARLVEAERADPYVAPPAAYFAAFTAAAGRLGLDPQSRAKLRMPPKKSNASLDPWAEFSAKN